MAAALSSRATSSLPCEARFCGSSLVGTPASLPIRSCVSKPFPGYNFLKISSRRPMASTSKGFIRCQAGRGGVEELEKEDEIAPEGLNGATIASEDSLVPGDGFVKGVSNALVGVLGGGQLGRMLCQAASPLGIKVAILDPLPDAPAGPLAYRHVVGSFRDPNSVEELSEGCEVVTVEIEHVDVEALESISEKGIRVDPSPGTLRIIQDKYQQKVHFKSYGIPLPEFEEVIDLESLISIAERFGYPFLLKAKKLAYDGRGNYVVRNEEDLEAGVNALGGFERDLYAEKFVPFVKELAVMVARCQNGKVSSYPVVQTIHKDNICHIVEAPANIPDSVRVSATKLVESAISSLSGAGIFGVELFLLPDQTVLLNEVAPRPHNSGHYTIESCYVSQYEQHLRAILGLPLGDPSMKVKAASMVNILGEDEGENGFRIANEMIKRALQVKGASIHWYDKPEIRSQRKMGHITVVGSDARDVRSKVKFISQALYSDEDDSSSEVLVGIIMGSDSDLPVMKDAAQVLSDFNIPHEVTIVSAHRTPERMFEYAKNAHYRGIKVIIAGAGGAAHLPGMVASLTPLPVIGVPVKSSSLNGLDSLLSIVQMPKGIPVSTVAINNATNAGLLAVRQLAAHDSFLLKKLMVYQEGIKISVEEKAERLEEIGWANYLDEQNS